MFEHKTHTKNKEQINFTYNVKNDIIIVMKPTVYIETSVISYLTSRPSRDLIIAAHQQITQDWWENSLKHYEAFISSVVIDEISRGDKKAAKLRLNSVEYFKILEVTDEVHQLSDIYFKNSDTLYTGRINGGI